MMAAMLTASKALRSVHSSYKMQPSAQMSVFASYFCPCSQASCIIKDGDGRDTSQTAAILSRCNMQSHNNSFSGTTHNALTIPLQLT